MFKKLLSGLAVAAVLGLSLGSAVIAQNFQAGIPPNITGVDSTKARSIDQVGFLSITRNAGLTAFATGGQANGVLLSYGMNQFTVVGTAGDSARLPDHPSGLVVFVVNASATSMNVFPQVGSTINALGVNGAYALAAGKAVIFFQGANGAWYANLSA